MEDMSAENIFLKSIKDFDQNDIAMLIWSENYDI